MVHEHHPAYDRVVDEGTPRERLEECFRRLYVLIRDAPYDDVIRLNRLRKIAFLLTRLGHKTYELAWPLTIDFCEWSMLKTESPEWADQHEQLIRETYPDFFKGFEGRDDLGYPS